MTRFRAVRATLSCLPCKASIGSNNTTPEWREMFRQAHTHGVTPPRFVCFPCRENQHRGCMRFPCECDCQPRKERAR